MTSKPGGLKTFFVVGGIVVAMVIAVIVLTKLEKRARIAREIGTTVVFPGPGAVTGGRTEADLALFYVAAGNYDEPKLVEMSKSGQTTMITGGTRAVVVKRHGDVALVRITDKRCTQCTEDDFARSRNECKQNGVCFALDGEQWYVSTQFYQRVVPYPGEQP